MKKISKKLVPDGSGGVGNTKTTPPKRTAPSKHWCFTWNNYPKDWENKLYGSMVPHFAKIVMQEETGENGTPHIQGYVEFKKKIRPLGTIGIKEIHWEKCRNVKASIEYCQKEDTRTGVSIIGGFPKNEKVKFRDTARALNAKKRVCEYIASYWANPYIEFCPDHDYYNKCWKCEESVMIRINMMLDDIKKRRH